MSIRPHDRIRFDGKKVGKGTGTVTEIRNFILHVKTDDGREILMSDVQTHIELLEVYDVKIKKNDDITTRFMELENVTRDDVKVLENLSEKYGLLMNSSKKMLEAW